MTTPSPVAPIGVFDSGVGGLSILQEIRKELPAENLLYVADTAHAPYGERTPEAIELRATLIVEFFVANHVKAIVVACNTATAIAIQKLRSQFSIPFVAIEPPVKPAARTTRSGVIGVMATQQTLNSEKFSRLVADHGNNVRVLLQSCPGLVERVEQADFDGEATRALLEKYLAPLTGQGADTIVLGCTHYHFLKKTIASIAPGVEILDPAPAVAREVRRRLAELQLLASGTAPGTERFWTTGAVDAVGAVISLLWGRPIQPDAVPLAAPKSN